MIGSITKHRGPPRYRCYECGAAGQHYAYECPRRFIRVLGYAPPGFGSDGVRDPAQWHGNELSPATRRAYPHFIRHFDLQPHPRATMLAEDFTDAVQVRPRPEGRGGSS